LGKINLLDGPIDSTLRRFAMPLAISFLINMLYAWVDMFYVSRLGSEAIAAVGVGEQILFFAFGIGIGFGVGSGVIVARRIGENKGKEAGQTATQSLVFMLIFGIIVAIALYFSIPILLDILNISGKVREFASSYLGIIIIGMPFNFIIFEVNSLIRSSGNSFIPMMILIIANVLNAILSPFFIFGLLSFPKWGVYGAGFATMLAQLLGSIIAFLILLIKYKKIEINFNKFRFDFSIIYKILGLGIPASLQVLSISVNRMVLTWMTNLFGTTILATYMLGLRVDLLVFMTIFAVGASIEIVTGQNIGADKPERIFKYHKSAVKQLSILMLGFGVIVFFFGRYFAMIFTNDADLIGKIAVYLKITSFSYVFFAIGIVSIRVISGAGDYFRSLKIVFFIIYVVQLPLTYGLSKYTGLNYTGIWIGILISQVMFSVVGLISLHKKKWLNVKI